MSWIRNRSLLLLLVLGSGPGCSSSTPVEPPHSPPVPVASTSPDEETTSEPEFITVAEMRQRLGVGENAHFNRVGRDFDGADLRNTGVQDLAGLRGQPLHELMVSGNPVSSLEPLRGMPLQLLDASKTSVADLSPLAECRQLEQVFLEATPVTDISPLTGLALSHVYLIDCPVQDLSPLAGMRLAELNLCRTGLTSLESLREVDTGILWLRETAISDLAPLAGKSLVSLDLQGTQVTDLAVLQSLRNLQRLNIAQTPVTDLSPLAGLPLTRLILTPERIQKGWEEIRQMPSIREIDTSFDGDQPVARSASEFWERFDRGEFKSESTSVP